MKKNLLTVITIIALLSAKIAHAQWINSLTVVPATPNTLDTIYVYADLSFSSGTCDQHTQFLSASPPNIYASALHCNGMLTFICSHTDTFKIDPLPAGMYNFIFHVDAGALPSPCTPGIIAGPTDSISFTVNSVITIPDYSTTKNDFLIYPNPASEFVFISSEYKEIEHVEVIITDVLGKTCIRIPTCESKYKPQAKLDISDFSQGIYFIQVRAGEKMYQTKFIKE